MNIIQIQNKLSAPHQGEISVLFPLIKARTHKDMSVPSNMPSAPYWAAQWWKLDQSNTFKALTEQEQEAILLGCNRALLNEAYFIEKSGLAYCAKMVLLAESTDTAQLYSIIGADEAKHLAWIEPYVSEEDKCKPHGKFLAFLSRLIETAPCNLLVYLVQIILEGWGLDHYQRMANGCKNSELQNIFLGILKDEALHHKSGQLVFNAASLTEQDQSDIETALKTYCDMVRVGPVSVLDVFSRIKGPLMPQEIRDIYAAIGHVAETGRKLQLLRSLMRQPGLEEIISPLERQGYFTPVPIVKIAGL